MQELAARKVDGYVKIWVDDRGGTVKKLPPAVYTAAIDEAHRHGLLTITHTFELDDVKAIMRAGIDGLAHPPWRSGRGGGRRADRAVQGAAERVRPADAVGHAQRDLRPPAGMDRRPAAARDVHRGRHQGAGEPGRRRRCAGEVEGGRSFRAASRSSRRRACGLGWATTPAPPTARSTSASPRTSRWRAWSRPA